MHILKDNETCIAVYKFLIIFIAIKEIYAIILIILIIAKREIYEKIFNNNTLQ